MDFGNWMVQNYSWIFSGCGVVVLSLLYKKITEKQPPKPQEDSKAPMPQGGNSIIHPFIERKIKLDTSKFSLKLASFVPVEKEEHIVYGRYCLDKIYDFNKFISNDGEYIKIPKIKIQEKLKNKTYPFKFILEVDHNRETIKEYYAKLLEADLTVTGLGTVNQNNTDKWLIWFLFNGEPYHQDIDSIVTLNHKLECCNQ